MAYLKQDIDISGSGIEKLKKGFLYLWSLQTSDEKTTNTSHLNDAGFSAIHGGTAVITMQKYHQIIETPNHSLPLSLVNLLINILKPYRSTQLKNFDAILAEVRQDIRSSKEHLGITEPESDEKTVVIHYDVPPEYKKYAVYIPNISKDLKSKILKLTDDQAQADGFSKTIDQWGKENYPRFRYFQQDKINPEYYRVHLSLLPKVKALLSNEGYVISEKGQAVSQQQIKIESIEWEVINQESFLVFKLALPYEISVNLRNTLMQHDLWRNGISWIGDNKYKLLPSKFDQIVKILSQFVDVSALKKKFAEKPTNIQSGKNQKPIIVFTDPNNGKDNKLIIKVPYYALDEEQKQLVKEIIYFNFPEAKMENYILHVEGDYDQYVKLGELLNRYGYDVSQLRKLFLAKLNNGGIKAKKPEGKIDKEFIENIDKRLPESNFDLYPAQKEGIAFLHSRSVGILGDSTGLGKTVQLISAAELKMQDDNHKRPTLIFTLKAVQKQFAEEIPKIVEKAEVSLDPLNPKTWTVLYYEMFSNGKHIKEYIESLKKANFGIVIFDELHKIKHDSSKRSQNIAEVVSEIPIRWGASATVSSNMPLDIRNQLVMLGHYLGRIPNGKFKREFAGMVPGGYGGAYIPGPEEHQIESAEKLNKWLHLSGIYIRREKNDVREMPNLTVTPIASDIDYRHYNQQTHNLIQKLKDPDLAISVLGAVRQALAIVKVPLTVKRVTELVKQGKKTVVFSCFVEAGRQITEQLRKNLEQINSKYTILTYTSDTPKKQLNQVKETFTNNSNAMVLVMSMKMGGTGIDFPNAAQNMVINDYDWTPEQAEQSEGRIYRINTIHPVNIEYIIAAQTPDDDLFEKLNKKRKIAAIIQKYRKDYWNDDESALKKIVSARQEMKRLDQETTDAVVKGLATTKESSNFKNFLKLAEQIKKW